MIFIYFQMKPGLIGVPYERARFVPMPKHPRGLVTVKGVQAPILDLHIPLEGRSCAETFFGNVLVVFGRHPLALLIDGEYYTQVPEGSRYQNLSSAWLANMAKTMQTASRPTRTH